MSEISAAAHPGSTTGITATKPTQARSSEKCEIRINIGIFSAINHARRESI